MSDRCAWCSTEIPSAGSGPTGRITPPLCTACAEHMVFQMGVPLQKMLDSLPAPIFVMNNDGAVEAANRMGYALLNKRPEQVEGRLGGVVFECAYARLPEGCGRTVHCSGCAIRRSVFHTFETGESLNAVPATLHCGNTDGPQDIDMLISTEKMGAVVLLRIDRMSAPVGAT